MGLPHLAPEEAVNREFTYHENISKKLLENYAAKHGGKKLLSKNLNRSLITSINHKNNFRKRIKMTTFMPILMRLIMAFI